MLSNYQITEASRGSKLRRDHLLAQIHGTVANWLDLHGIGERKLTQEELGKLVTYLGKAKHLDCHELAQHVGADRFYLTLWSSRCLDVYLLVWDPTWSRDDMETGAATGWHDHGNAEAGIYVVDGEVREDVMYPEDFHCDFGATVGTVVPGGPVVAHVRREGETLTIPAPSLHNVGDDPEESVKGIGSITIHAYSGPDGGLADMRYYDVRPDGSLVVRLHWKKCEGDECSPT